MSKKSTMSRKSTSFLCTHEFRRKNDWKPPMAQRGSQFQKISKKLSCMNSSDKFTLVIRFNDNQPDTFCRTKMPSVAMMNCLTLIVLYT